MTYQFFTPPAVALQLADISVAQVLTQVPQNEPSAGTGMLARACWRGHFGAGMLARASKYMAIRGSLPVPASNRANPDFCTKGCGHDRWLAEELAELFDFPAVVSVILAGGNGGGGGCPHPSGVPAPHPAWPVPVRWRHVVSRRWIWRVWLRQFTYCRFSSGASFPRAPSLLSHCWGMN